MRHLLSMLSLLVPLAACGGAGSADDPPADPLGEGGASGTAGTSTAAGTGGSSGTSGTSAAGTGGTGQGGTAGTAGTAGSGGSAGAQAGTGGVAGTSGGSGAAGTGGAALPVCIPQPACDGATPDPGSKSSWKHSIESPIIVATGSPNHRGRDLFLNPGDKQWAIAKFAYGLSDKDLKDEEVDVYIQRNCSGSWEKLGTGTTTQDNNHPEVEGVADSGGRIYFEIPKDKALGIGRHRAHFVVKGDLSTTDALIDVVPPQTPMIVSDVDGTLTTSETEEFAKLLTGQTPQINPDAAAVFQGLVKKGYRVFYMTARPEFLVGRTREFVKERGLPPGLVHTTLGLTGAMGGAASGFKTGELALLKTKGLVPSYAFGNTDTDATAYFNAMISPAQNRVFFKFTDAAHGGRRIEAYTELLSEVAALPALCK